MTGRPDAGRLSTRPVPSWFTETKLGVAVHWGLYSVPAFAEAPDLDFSAFMRDLLAGKDTRGRLPYAEFYLNALRVPGSRTANHHASTYGDASYFAFQSAFEEAARHVDFADWAETFRAAGAGYVVMSSRHLDGYSLWPSRVPHPAMPIQYRSSRDLIGEASAAVRASGLRMGLYYGGGLDWTLTDFPVRTMADLMRQQAHGPVYAEYATAQWRELIARYQPSLLWNDMGWPAESDPNQLVAEYYAAVPDGVVNDRWTQVRLPRGRLARAGYLRFAMAALKVMARTGRPLPTPPRTFHSDYETHEYAVPEHTPSGPWELIRGIGKSFGLSAAETTGDSLSGTELIALLADVVSQGGNLLVNVGPDATGCIPDLQRQPLRELGAWLQGHGEAIYGTRPWDEDMATTTTTGESVRFTQRDGIVYAIVLGELTGESLGFRDLRVPAETKIDWLRGPSDVPWTATDGGVRLETSAAGRGSAASVVAIHGLVRNTSTGGRAVPA